MILQLKPEVLIRRHPDEIRNWLDYKGIDFEFIYTPPVYTCGEAATARKVPLHNELKTLLIVHQDNLALLNLPGDRVINRKLVRAALATHSFRLASIEEMAILKVGRGIISPLSLGGCRSLIDSEVLTLKWITTNAGSLTVGIRIGVAELLAICNPEVAHIVADASTDNGGLT